MKFVKLQFIIFVTLATCLSLQSQDDLVKYNFKKGEAIDILLLNQKDGNEDVLKRYFDKAIPIAAKNGYRPKPAFPIIESPMQGNYHPDVMIMASWPSVVVRRKGLVELETTLSDFHEMRRKIWSTFNIAYYEATEDLSFEIDKSKYNVATAYWSKDDKSMSNYMSKWKKLVSKTKGSMIVQLTSPMSTFGYIYKPDYFLVASWDSKEDFDAFKAKNIKMDHFEVEQVQQFKLQ